jgi:tRNA dimethylallyltransferase
MTRPKLIIITGATAAGKSAFIYNQLAGLPLTIINADSRQVYEGIAIASASPTRADLEKFPHALYNFLPLTQAFSAGEFTRAAKAEIARAQGAGRIPLICGGTYFYLQALLYGLLPGIDIPNGIQQKVEEMTSAEAFAELQKLDPVAAAQNHEHNTVRVRRAVMLCMTHGVPISTLAKTGGIEADFEILMLIFDMGRDILRRLTAERVTKMFAVGLVAEIQQVLTGIQQSDIKNWRLIPALTGIGIREFLEVYDQTGKLPAELSPEELHSVELAIAQNTIRLVKRQQTWYKNATPKPANTKTVDPSYENERIAALVKEFAI